MPRGFPTFLSPCNFCLSINSRNVTGPPVLPLKHPARNPCFSIFVVAGFSAIRAVATDVWARGEDHKISPDRGRRMFNPSFQIRPIHDHPGVRIFKVKDAGALQSAEARCTREKLGLMSSSDLDPGVEESIRNGYSSFDW